MDYIIRQMDKDDKAQQQHLCYSEKKARTMLRVLEEQIALWLIPALILLVLLVNAGKGDFAHMRWIMLPLYMSVVLVGVVFKYSRERKQVTLMEKQSEPIAEEFLTGKVEEAECDIISSFLVAENEDEGPTYVLEIGKDLYTFVCEHGKSSKYESTPGNHIKIVRLPISRIILRTQWSGTPMRVIKVLNPSLIHDTLKQWKPGDVFKLAGALM